MKAFFAALLGLLAIAVALPVLVFGVGPFGSWKERTAGLANYLPGDESRARAQQAERDAAHSREEKRRAQREIDELQEQRRERLTLLTATLGVRPVGSLTRTEKQLFQQAERNRASTSGPARGSRVVALRERVQIDEWTVLHAGTSVEFIHYDCDGVATIRHDGARYQVGSHQITPP